LDKYLYGGEDGEERKKNDLDDELDSYWDHNAVKPQNEEVQVEQNGNNKEEQQNHNKQINEKEEDKTDKKENNEANDKKDKGDDKAQTE